MAERPDIVVPRIDILDLFLGQGRTIRRSKTTPGRALLQGKYEHVRHRLPPKLDEKKVDEVKLDAPKDESKQDKPDADTSKGDTRKEESKDNNDTGKPNMEFTPEHDAELLRLKEEKTSWKGIAAAIDKPVWQLKQRFGELKANDAAAGAATAVVTTVHDKPSSNVSKPASGAKAVSGKEQKAASEAKSKKEPTKSTKETENENTKKEKWEQFKKQHAQKQQPPKPKQTPKTPTPPANSVIAPSSTTGTLFELTEDDMFSYSELQLLVEVLEADVGMVWDRVASAFFNKTGRRILPLDIKEKLRGM